LTVSRKIVFKTKRSRTDNVEPKHNYRIKQCSTQLIRIRKTKIQLKIHMLKPCCIELVMIPLFY